MKWVLDALLDPAIDALVDWIFDGLVDWVRYVFVDWDLDSLMKSVLND